MRLFKLRVLNGVYLPLEVHDLATCSNAWLFRVQESSIGVRGLSITAPHKVEVMKFLDWIDPVIKGNQAVNTVVLQDERLLGYNTDADGLIEPLVNESDLCWVFVLQ